MTNGKIVSQYIPLVHFLGEALGKNCEVVLHDLEDPDNSVIAISHGELSSRKIGDPMTNLLLRVLQKSNDNNFLTNYTAKASHGKKFKASTYFITNKDGKKIGALCLNFEISRYQNLFDDLNEILDFTNNSLLETESCEETFTSSSEDTINLLVNTALSHSLVAVEDMPVDDKLSIIDTLVKEGAFLYKGSVPQVADLLKVSEPTIYRYIAKVKKQSTYITQ